MPHLTKIDNFIADARNGKSTDPDVFVAFARQFDSVVIWGAGNLGTAVAKKIRALGVTLSSFWDAQAEHIVERNGVPVIAPFSGSFNREKTIILFCIGNVAVAPNVFRQLSENGWHHVLHGNDLVQGLICPLSDEKPVNTAICNNFDICSVCSCERLHSIVRSTAARKLELPPEQLLSFDRVHFIVNNVCNLKCTHCFLYINSYPKERKQNVETGQLLQDIQVIMRTVHSFGVVNIFGGETFLHKDIDQIITSVLSYENFGSVIVNTNGIARIKPQQMKAMRDSRVRLALSNYLEVLDEAKKEIFFKNIESAKASGVNAKYQNALPTWNISSSLEHKGDTRETMVEKKAACGVRFLYVFDGKLFPCAFSLSINDLGVADYASDYVTLDPELSPEALRSRIRAMLARPHYGACGHCENFGASALTGTAAEQGFDKRYALPGRDSRTRRVRIPVVVAP
jgi:organic radical activating enzyme